MKKRTAALIFLALVVTAVAATLVTLRTAWAGDRLCALAAERVRTASGLPVSFGGCRVEPLSLTAVIEGLALGPPERPIFQAERVEARLSAVQALGRQLHLEQLRVVHPQVRLALAGRGSPPDAAGGTCPPALLSRFDVRTLDLEQGEVEVETPEVRLRLEGLSVRAAPAPRTLRTLAQGGARRSRLELSVARTAAELRGRTFHASGLAAAGELAMDLSAAQLDRASVDLDGVRLGLSGTVEDLCDPRFDLTATADGQGAALLALAGVPGDVSGEVSLAAHVAGTVASPALSGTARLKGVTAHGFGLGDAEAQVRLAGDTLRVERLVLPTDGGQVAIRGAVRLVRGLPTTADVELAGVELGEVLHRLTVRDPWITLRLDGKGHVEGPLWPPALEGRLELGLRNLKALTRSYREGGADPGVVAFEKGHIATAVKVDAEALVFTGAQLQMGRGAVAADAAIHFNRAGGFRVEARGDVDLTALGRVASLPMAGLATLDARLGAAPYGAPRIEGHGRATGLRFLDVDLGAATTDFLYDAGKLHFAGVDGARASARYRGDLLLDLHRTPTQLVSAHVQARGRVHDLCDAVMDWLPRTRYLRDALDGEVELTASAQGPAATPDADFDATLGAGALLGRSFTSGRAVGHIRAAQEVRFERAELRRESGLVRAQGTWGLAPPFSWDLQLAASGLPLEALGLPGSWAGLASGTASLAGSFEQPRVRGALSADAVAVSGVRLGKVEAGGTLTGTKLLLTAGAEGVDLSAEASLEGRMPFRARGTVAVEDLARWVDGVPRTLRAHLAGEAAAEGELADLAQAHLSATATQLALSYADLRVEATGPVRLSAARGRWELAPVTLRGQSTELTISGVRAATGALDVAASGALDLRLLAGAVPPVRRAHGTVALEAHLGGTLDEPLLVGAGRVADAGFQVRGLAATFADVRGGLAFSQNRVLFDRLDASVNGGRATFKGAIELQRLIPARLDVEGTLEEVPLAVLPALPATFSGRIAAAGTPDATTVTGKLHVNRARYTADVDLEGSLLELRRRPAPVARAYDRADEWLRFDLQLAVDGDVRVENDMVRGPLAGDLTVTGTLAAPGVVGSLAMGQGSRLLFRGNEFNLTHAILDFTDRSRIDMGVDVTGESAVRDYQVFLHVLGPAAQPKVTLTSLPALPEQDIVTLLSLGYTRRDAGAGGGVGGVATAAAAQALFSASGLDAQVRRFLPRGGPVRDLSMRITTGYSEETGQVEPLAEFESWLMKDKLRLRFQSPLSNTRGRKAQAELRLGDHTALQYQWDNESPDVSTGDHGLDLKLRWEWSDDR
ncbi:MAG: translocation/assembly module TamB domain-containing protein [Anaeromyxobacter sp.]